MTSRELRQKFLEFFEERGHKIIPSSSLLPADSSVLFTTAGMQQFSLYLAGEKDVLKDFGTRHLASCQKCFRSDDIEDIGDDTHNTFFEMLGNWSIGQDEKGSYFKEEAIKFACELLTSNFGLPISKLWVTVFKGNQEIPKDEESIKIWQKQGIPRERIREFGEQDNLWGPIGETGPCGPCSEIHYDRGKDFAKQECSIKGCGPNCKCGRFVEIWNLVFMEYHKKRKAQSAKRKVDFEYAALPQKNVDTGMGFERAAAILQNKPSAYETDLFFPIIQEIEKLSGKKYETDKKTFRIIADHIRGSVFLIGEGVLPSNIEQGYVLRKVLRRAMRYGKMLDNAGRGFLIPLATKVIEIYRDVYPELLSKQTDIFTVIQKEEEKFGKAIEKGLNQFEKLVNSKFQIENSKIKGEDMFDLYQSYGFPLEMIEELAKEKGLEIDEKGFWREFRKHQKVSRIGAEKKFGGGGKFSPKLHTATHLLQAALRKVLGSHIKQMGSDITSERLRFDFSHPEKMTPEQIKKVEDIVNQKIKQNLEVVMEEMPLKQAISSGALSFFREKYPETVRVYSIGKFSKEICAGPHVKKTGELKAFKIIKEQSCGAGVRRIKAILLPA